MENDFPHAHHMFVFRTLPTSSCVSQVEVPNDEFGVQTSMASLQERLPQHFFTYVTVTKAYTFPNIVNKGTKEQRSNLFLQQQTDEQEPDALIRPLDRLVVEANTPCKPLSSDLAGSFIA